MKNLLCFRARILMALCLSVFLLLTGSQAKAQEEACAQSLQGPAARAQLSTSIAHGSNVGLDFAELACSAQSGSNALSLRIQCLPEYRSASGARAALQAARREGYRPRRRSRNQMQKSSRGLFAVRAIDSTLGCRVEVRSSQSLEIAASVLNESLERSASWNTLKTQSEQSISRVDEATEFPQDLPQPRTIWSRTQSVPPSGIAQLSFDARRAAQACLEREPTASRTRRRGRYWFAWNSNGSFAWVLHQGQADDSQVSSALGYAPRSYRLPLDAFGRCVESATRGLRFPSHTEHGVLVWWFPLP